MQMGGHLFYIYILNVYKYKYSLHVLQHISFTRLSNVFFPIGRASNQISDAHVHFCFGLR